MRKDRNLIPIMAVFLFMFGIFASSAWSKDEVTSPESVTKKFAKAYFMLDESMGDYLSADARMNEDEKDMVELYLDMKEYEARKQGYKLSYFQMLPLNMKATVLSQDDESARVEFTASTIRNINPLYRIVGFIFCLMDEHEVRQVIDVVKEDGAWKVGPGAFDLPTPM